jgi:hypothetical protein
MRIKLAVMLCTIVFAILVFSSISASAGELQQFSDWLYKYTDKNRLPSADEIRIKRESLNVDSESAQVSFKGVVNDLNNKSELFNKIRKFEDWMHIYTFNGLVPTEEEIKTEGKYIKLDAQFAKTIFDILVNEPDADQMSNKRLKISVGVSNLGIMATKSKSNTTRLLGVKMVKLNKAYLEERERREAEVCERTADEVINLSHIVMERLKSEKTIEDVYNNLPSGKSISLLSDEQEIRSLLGTFYQKEEDPNFIPRPWVDNLLETKFNPYIDRYNASLGGNNTETITNKKNAHDILD